MSNPRFTGLLLLLMGVLVLMGNTLDVLPPQAFWAGLLTYPIGGYLLFKGSRRAIREPQARPPIREPQARTARAPKLRLATAAGEAHAARQSKHVANPNPPRGVPAEAPNQDAPASEGPEPVSRDPIVLFDLDSEEPDLEVTTDVSYPIEVQERDSIATQLEKLGELCRQGVITPDELAVAKAKLLG